MGAEWNCGRCGRLVDRKDDHRCDPFDIAEHLAEESGENDEEINERLERIERRQRMLAGAVLVALRGDRSDAVFREQAELAIACEWGGGL